MNQRLKIQRRLEITRDLIFTLGTSVLLSGCRCPGRSFGIEAIAVKAEKSLSLSNLQLLVLIVKQTVQAYFETCA